MESAPGGLQEDGALDNVPISISSAKRPGLALTICGDAEGARTERFEILVLKKTQSPPGVSLASSVNFSVVDEVETVPTEA